VIIIWETWDWQSIEDEIPGECIDCMLLSSKEIIEQNKKLIETIGILVDKCLKYENNLKEAQKLSKEITRKTIEAGITHEELFQKTKELIEEERKRLE